MTTETREQWLEMMSEGIVSEVGEETELQMMEHIEFRMENDEPKFNEEAFLEFCGGFGGTLFHMLGRLDTPTGFSSTVKNMSFEEKVSLAHHLCSHVGAKLLCRICDRFKNFGPLHSTFEEDEEDE